MSWPPFDMLVGGIMLKVPVGGPPGVPGPLVMLVYAAPYASLISCEQAASLVLQHWSLELAGLVHHSSVGVTHSHGGRRMTPLPPAPEIPPMVRSPPRTKGEPANAVVPSRVRAIVVWQATRTPFIRQLLA